MKTVLVSTTLALASAGAWAQTTDSQTSSAAQSGATAIGGGAASVSSLIGGSKSNARGGTGGNAAGGSANSAVSVYLGNTDPNPQGQAQALQQQVPTGDPTTRVDEHLKTVGNPGAMSFGISFSQYNCANTAGGGVGFMGGVVQIGGGLESAPCNARANASALFQIAQTLATTNPTLSSQLFHAAVLLIGNSTKDTRAALAEAGVSDWSPTPTTAAPIVPPVPPPADEGKATPVPAPDVAVAPLPTDNVTDEDTIKRLMFAGK